jgi:hypothetical protein
VNYRILVKLNPDDVPLDGPPRIRLSFDKFFVPEDIATNQHARQLVIMAPTLITSLPGHLASCPSGMRKRSGMRSAGRSLDVVEIAARAPQRRANWSVEIGNCE